MCCNIIRESSNDEKENAPMHCKAIRLVYFNPKHLSLRSGRRLVKCAFSPHPIDEGYIFHGYISSHRLYEWPLPIYVAPHSDINGKLCSSIIFCLTVKSRLLWSSSSETLGLKVIYSVWLILMCRLSTEGKVSALATDRIHQYCWVPVTDQLKVYLGTLLGIKWIYWKGERGPPLFLGYIFPC